NQGIDPQAANYRSLAAFGHAAMEAVLASVRRAGAPGHDRAAVVRAFTSLRLPRSAVGALALRRGDVAERRVGAYRVRGGRLAFEGVLPARP
ncbi:MAG: hypothetical protein M3P39_07435, partial [Actinomycetota bacterium]|nr:hypothetical protein [Actinomycetota bacterium]